MVGSSICLHSVLVRIPAVGMLAPAWPQSGHHGPGQVAPPVWPRASRGLFTSQHL